MEKQFVTYEIALDLKELCFDEECFGFYNHNGLLFYQCIAKQYDGYIDISKVDFSIFKEDISAPLWQQVIDWLRDKYGLHIEIQSPDFKHEYQFNWTIHKIQQFGGFANGSSNNFYEAREQAILKCIELVKNK